MITAPRPQANAAHARRPCPDAKMKIFFSIIMRACMAGIGWVERHALSQGGQAPFLIHNYDNICQHHARVMLKSSTIPIRRSLLQNGIVAK